MGLFARLRGTDQPPEVQRAVSELEARLPEGWRFIGLRSKLFGRRPVKLSVCGAIAKGPNGQQALAVGTDEDLGVRAVRGLIDVVEGRSATSKFWAPPAIRQREPDPYLGGLRELETTEEAEARAEALALLPDGARPMNADAECFGKVTVYAVVVQMPEGFGLAGAALTPAEAWQALTQRLRGTLVESALWFPSR